METAVAVETPAAPMSLREHIAAETPAPAKPVETPAIAAPVLATPAPAAAVAETPEQEAAGSKPDADVSEAARTLRKNRADERKAKIQREINDLIAERNRLRDETAARREPERPTPAITAPSDGAFRFPEYAAWATGENDGQPFEAFLNARDDARDAWRESQSRVRAQRESVERSASQTAQKLDEQHQTTREKFGDFDAVIADVAAALHGSHRGSVLADFCASSEVGGEVAYRLGKDPEAMTKLKSATSPIQAIRVLSAIEASIAAPKVAPKPLTNAPAPPKQSVAASASAATHIDTRKGVPLADHIRIEEAEIADRRARGYRY